MNSERDILLPGLNAVPFLSSVVKFVDGDTTEIYSSYKRQRILYLAKQGHKPPTFCRLMREEGFSN